MWHILNVIFWQNAGVGNFTATALGFAGGFVVGKRHYNKHVKPVLHKVHEIHAAITSPTQE